jgi:hypothetical protein
MTERKSSGEPFTGQKESTSVFPDGRLTAAASLLDQFASQIYYYWEQRSIRILVDWFRNGDENGFWNKRRLWDVKVNSSGDDEMGSDAINKCQSKMATLLLRKAQGANCS